MHCTDSKSNSLNTKWKSIVLQTYSVFDATNGIKNAPFIGYLDKDDTDIHLDNNYTVFISMHGQFYKVVETLDGAGSIIAIKVNRNSINIKATFNYMLC